MSEAWKTTGSVTTQLYRSLQLGAVFLGAFAVAALIAGLLFPAYQSLVWFSLYVAVSNFFIPWIAQEPIVLLYGGLFAPWLVAVVGAVATCWMELFNYQMLGRVVRSKRVSPIVDSPTYKKTERWFQMFPFIGLVIAGATPVPFAPFRVFAVTSNYPLSRYLLSVFVARAPRYFVLALIGDFIQLPSWVYGAIIGVLVLAAFWHRIWRRRRQRAVDRPAAPASASSQE